MATNSTPIGLNAISRGLNGLTAAYGTMSEVTGQESPQEGRHGKLCLPRPANFTTGQPPGTAPHGVTPRLPGTEQLGPNRIQCAGTSHRKVGNILQQSAFGPGRCNVLDAVLLNSLTRVSA